MLSGLLTYPVWERWGVGSWGGDAHPRNDIPCLGTVGSWGGDAHPRNDIPCLGMVGSWGGDAHPRNDIPCLGTVGSGELGWGCAPP